MNIILVEGMDGAGKTTLINKLVAMCPDARVHHFTAEDVKKVPNNILRYYDMLATAAEAGTKTIILDRGWYSDFVYSLIMRYKEEISQAEINIIERMAKGYGDLTVLFVTTTVDTAWKRCKQRGEDYIPDKATLMCVCAEYNKLIKEAKSKSVAAVYEVKT